MTFGIHVTFLFRNLEQSGELVLQDIDSDDRILERRHGCRGRLVDLVLHLPSSLT